MKMLTISEFAEAINVTQSTLSKWRNIKKNNVPPPDDYLKRVGGSKAPLWKSSTVAKFYKGLKDKEQRNLKEWLCGVDLTKEMVLEYMELYATKEKISKKLKIKIKALTLFCKLNNISMKSIGSSERPSEESEHSPKYFRAFKAANDAFDLVVRKRA